MSGHIHKLVCKDGTVRWVAVASLGGGKQLWRRFPSRKAADLWLGEVARSRVRNESVPLLSSKLLLREYLDRWLQDIKRRVSPTTYVMYQSITERSLKPNLGHVPLSRLSQPLIASWLTKLAETNLSPTTQLFHFRVLQSALSDAVEDKTISHHSCDKRCKPPRKAKPLLPQWDEEEARLFLAESKRSSKYHAIYLTALMTGMRRGEILGLRWSNVEFFDCSCVIQQTQYEVDGKIGFKPPKSDSSKRKIDLPESVMEAFRQIQTQQQEAKALLGDRYTDLDLIFTQHNGKPLYVSSIAKEFQRVIKRAKVKRIRFHDMRHFHVGLLIDQGENARLISERVGHASVGFTLQQYGFLMKGAQRQAAAKLETRLFGKRNGNAKDS